MERNPTSNNRRCSFCGKKAKKVKLLIVGFKASICDECIKNCEEIFSDALKKRLKQVLLSNFQNVTSDKLNDPEPSFLNEVFPKYKCSFCGRTDWQVNGMIAGNEGYICDECVKTCKEIMKKNEGR